MKQPPLKPLHVESSIVPGKLAHFRRLTTQELLDSLAPGQPGALKTKVDGTMMDGHHRISVLRERGIAVDDLPREIIPRGRV
ncbi:MAG: hypothetical protein ACKV2V_27785 [Blastocatellia bacterium]